MGIPAGYKELIDSLSRGTSARKIEWTHVGDESFAHVLPELSIEITGAADDRGDPRVIVALRNAGGERIDGFYIDEGQVDFSKLSELLGEARRTAFGVDNAIQRIRESLRVKGI